MGIIVRVPLASGLLADAFDGIEDFGEDDHRRWATEEGVEAGVGRKGGETFAGILRPIWRRQTAGRPTFYPL